MSLTLVRRRRQGVLPRAVCGVLSAVCCALSAGCGYTTRPGLASYLKTVYIKPFGNQIDLTQVTSNYQQYPVYRHGLEIEITKAVMNRFQFTGLLRPTQSEQADSRLEGELVEFRRDALRFSASQQVEEWRLSLVVNLRFFDLHTNQLMWEEARFTGDTTYFAVGANAESESTAINRAIQDLARRIVERAVENW
jgi:hypothetical protein